MVPPAPRLRCKSHQHRDRPTAERSPFYDLREIGVPGGQSQPVTALMNNRTGSLLLFVTWTAGSTWGRAVTPTDHAHRHPDP